MGREEATADVLYPARKRRDSEEGVERAGGKTKPDGGLKARGEEAEEAEGGREEEEEEEVGRGEGEEEEEAGGEENHGEEVEEVAASLPSVLPVCYVVSGADIGGAAVR